MQQEKKEFVKDIKFNITQEQIDKIRPFMENLDEILKGTLSEFENELDDAIIYELDDDYESTPNSRMLQQVYDEIYDQN